MTISNYDDIIDSRDVIERIDMKTTKQHITPEQRLKILWLRSPDSRYKSFFQWKKDRVEGTVAKWFKQA